MVLWLEEDRELRPPARKEGSRESRKKNGRSRCLNGAKQANRQNLKGLLPNVCYGYVCPAKVVGETVKVKKRYLSVESQLQVRGGGSLGTEMNLNRPMKAGKGGLACLNRMEKRGSGGPLAKKEGEGRRRFSLGAFVLYK